MTPDEAAFTIDRVQYRITVQQWADDAEYARRALERLQANPRPAPDEGRDYLGWEREVLERQVLNYVLANGYFPSRETVKKLKDNAREAKHEMPKKAQLNLALKVAA